MKILTLPPQYLPVLGGIEVFTAALAQSLKRRSVETTIITDCDLHGLLPDHETIDGVSVYRLPFLRSLRASDSIPPLRVLSRLTELVETIRPDLIHMHSAVQVNAWFIDRLIGKLSPRLPFVVTQHGMLEKADLLDVVRSLILKADALTGVSDAVLRSALQFSGRAAGTSLIFNGVVMPETPSGRHRTEPPFILACVGRQQHEKGFDLAIEALATIRRDGIDASLTIVGAGEQRKDFVALAERLSMSPHVRFAGVLDRQATLDVIASSTLLLVPSRTREGFSLVVAEAALCGVPAVASRLGGLMETVEDGVSGLLFTPDDHHDLASTISTLLRDPAQLRAMGMNARQRGQEKFDMDRCAGQYFKLYRGLIH